MTRFNHDEALRRFLNAAQATTSTTAKPKTAKEVKEDIKRAFDGDAVWYGMDFADAEARVWTHYVDGADLGREQVEGIKRAWEYASGGGVTWWTENGRRGVAYPNGRGVMTPLLDGKTGDIVEISKADQYAAGYSKANDVYRILKVMERFDELPVIR